MRTFSFADSNFKHKQQHLRNKYRMYWWKATHYILGSFLVLCNIIHIVWPPLEIYSVLFLLQKFGFMPYSGIKDLFCFRNCLICENIWYINFWYLAKLLQISSPILKARKCNKMHEYALDMNRTLVFSSNLYIIHAL